MAIRFGLSPWGAIGGFAGGLAEGALAGSTIAAQQQRMQLAREQMEQTRLQNALGMLLKGAELEQVMPGMGVQIMQKAGELAPQLKLGGGEGGFPWSHEQALKARAQRAATEADILSSLDPTLAAHRGSLLAQLYGIKDPKLDKIDPVMGILAKLKLPRDPAQWTQQQGAQFLTEYLTYLTEKKGTEFQARMNFNVPMPGMGGRGGGGGVKEVKWYDPETNKFLGWFPRHAPPTSNAVPDRSTEREVAVNITELKILYDLTEADTKMPAADKQRKLENIKRTMEEAGGMGQIMTTPTGVPSRVKSKVKKPPGKAAPIPWGGTDTPPPSGQ